MSVSDKILRTFDRSKDGVRVDVLGRLFASSDQKGHQFIITVLDNGLPVSLSGASVSGLFINANDEPVGLPFASYGAIDTANSTASITLPAGCYAVKGHFDLYINLTQGGETHAVYHGQGYITPATGSGSPIDPGTVITDIDTLITDVSQAQADIEAVEERIEELGGVLVYTEQTLTGQQKAQSRVNIDALSGADAGYTAIPYVAGSYIRVNQTGVIDLENPVAADICHHAVIPVQQGDRFTVSGKGGNADRLWAWIATDGRIIRQHVASTNNPQTGVDFAASGVTATGLELVAPAGAAYLVINTEDDQQSYYGFKPGKIIASTEKAELRHNYAIKRETAKVPFAFKPFSGPMVSFVFDDLRSDLDLTASIFAEYGYPLCVAAIPKNLDNVASGLSEAAQGYTPGMTMRAVMNRVVSLGGEILTHGSNPITDTNQFDQDFMRQYFVTSKETLEGAGFSVRGLIRVGTSGTLVPSVPTARIEEWLIGSYDYSNMGDNYNRQDENAYRMADNYSVNRVLFSNTTVDAVKADIDAAIASPAWLVYGGHTVSGSGADFPEASLREILAYCQANNVPVVTWSYVFDQYSGTTLGNAEAENVKFTAQSLTAAQQTQARGNIGAANVTIDGTMMVIV